MYRKHFFKPHSFHSHRKKLHYFTRSAINEVLKRSSSKLFFPLSAHAFFDNRSHSHSLILFLHISMPSQFHVKTARLELTILLTEGTVLAATMKEAIVARAFMQRILLPHFRTVEAGVQAWTPSYQPYQYIKRSRNSAWRWSLVNNLSNLSKGNAWAPECHATVAAIWKAIEEAGGPRNLSSRFDWSRILNVILVWRIHRDTRCRIRWRTWIFLVPI